MQTWPQQSSAPIAAESGTSAAMMVRAGLMAVVLLAVPVSASVLQDTGFTKLKSELGSRLPTGKGVSVGQVESWVEVDRRTATSIVKERSWMPDPRAKGLGSYNIIDRSGAPDGVYSGHATAVARRILGRGPGQGMASEVELYEVFSIPDWFGPGMLRGATDLAPAAVPLRVINHSWAANSRDSRILRRCDWLTEHDEVIQVVGIRNAEGKENVALLAAAINAIVVGRSDGKHSVGTPAIDETYVSGRVRPHLVAPLNTASAAAPTVTSAVILLLETASNPALSTRREPVRNRNGQQIYDAGRSEVIRAVLMAGADRETNNSRFGNISSYRDSVDNRADNGLDKRYGAGQLNVYHSWHILDAGEQEQIIGPYGFDYEPGLANSDGMDSIDQSGSIRRYDLQAVAAPTILTTTLSWNVLFPYSSETRFDASAVVNDLDLSLYEISDGRQRLVQAANSRIDTTETILADLMPGKRYQLVVTRVDHGAVPQDYAVAWRMYSEKR